MVIECFCVACCDNVSQILYLHFHIPGSVCVGIPYQCGYGGKVTHSSCVLPITPVYYLLPQCTTYYPSVLPITPVYYLLPQATSPIAPLGNIPQYLSRGNA